MKRAIAITLAVIFLVVILIPGNITTATTSESYNGYAMKLYSIGLFKGTETSFELERVPTRLEGAVMFVRLLGGESEALDKNYNHPFNDVPEWGSPYVGYLYHYELTNGISESEFGTSLNLRAAEYVTFGLRALGYSDKGEQAEFSWETSVAFAYSNGVVSDDLYYELNNIRFTRGQVAWTSYEFLLSSPTGHEMRLIDSLVTKGSINSNAAGSVFPEYNIGTREVPAIGDSWSSVLSDNGLPTVAFLSRYGFEWNVFGMDYSNYIQIGQIEGSVKGLVLASYGYGYERDISIGMTRDDVVAAYGHTGLTEIRKPVTGENTTIIYILDNTDKASYISEDGNYITYYYDSYNGDKITALLVVDKETEETTHNTLQGDMAKFERAFEEQIYQLTNAYRVQMGLEFLVKSTSAANAAKDHSVNMADNDFFSHTDPQGRGPGDRVSEKGVPYRYLGENLAYGYINPVDMVNGWFNSQTGHRDVMLGDFIYLGVGSAIKDNKVHYCTQEYWR
ncbi:MAG: hypothetical protein JW903_06795 [Clostridia bacterium]|nr:hypothetical protein [Clostridia bacterium]